MVRKIAEIVPEETLKRDLENYRQKALKLGASDARIITTDMVVVDERVRAKCTYPKCEYYGTCTNCPPYSMEPEQTRKLVSRFQYAIFYKLNVPTEVLAGKLTSEQKKQSLQFAKKGCKYWPRLNQRLSMMGTISPLGSVVDHVSVYSAPMRTAEL